jgi:hypothetical protein
MGSLVAASSALRANDLLTRTYPMQAGWNAMHLDLEPINSAVEAVFAGLPLEAVWRHQQRLNAVEFVQDPTEPVWNRDRWLVHVPTDRVESLDNNLVTVLGGFSYLVRLGSPATLVVTGRPTTARPRWKTDAFNLRGFPVDPGAPPTFRDFFKFSPAHYRAETGALEAIYRLSTTGQWQLVAATDLMQDGVPYWVYTRGGSDYAGPLRVEFDGIDGLDFGESLAELELRLENLSGGPVTVTCAEIGAPATSALAYAREDAVTGTTWPGLPPLLALELSAGERRTLRLAARRGLLAASPYATNLEVRDNAGLFVRIPVRILGKAASENPGPALAGRNGRRALQGDPASFAGLWVGNASIHAVSEVHSGSLVTNRIGSGLGVVIRTNAVTGELTSETVTNASPEPVEIERVGISTNPTPVRVAYDLRVLIHVDAGGTARMLEEVTQLWRDGSYETNAAGQLVVRTPGNHVLLTDDALVARFQGAALRDGRPVGRRISTVHFDFPSQPAGNALELTGELGTNGTLRGTYTLLPDSPTNPFKHRYHPDHDNLDPTFKQFAAEAFEIVRVLEFECLPADPGTGPAVADYGHDVLAGNYRETVSQLHREPIHALGTFRLRRVSDIAELNPSPAP